MVTLVHLLPLFLLIAISLTALGLVVKSRSGAEAKCRQTLWQAQRDMGTLLENLLRLNPRAKRLQNMRKTAEAQLKAALLSANPGWVAEAQAFRATVIGLQLSLHAEQIQLLARARIRRARLKAEFKGLTQATPILALAQNEKVTDLAVRAEPPQDLSPTYQTLPSFSDIQAVALHFRIRLLSWAPAFINNFYDTKNDHYDGQCFVTLQQEGSKWTPTLKEAKFILN